MRVGGTTTTMAARTARLYGQARSRDDIVCMQRELMALPGFRFSWERENEVCGVFLLEDEDALREAGARLKMQLLLGPVPRSSSKKVAPPPPPAAGAAAGGNRRPPRVLPQWMLAKKPAVPKFNGGGGGGGSAPSLLCPTSLLPDAPSAHGQAGLEVWQRILEHLLAPTAGHELTALVLLSMANRELYGLAWDNHRLMRHVLFQRLSMVGTRGVALPHEVLSPGAVLSLPEGWRYNAVVPLHQRPAFNAYVHKAVVLATSRWCAVCGRSSVKPTVLAGLGLTACRPCVADRLVSDRVLETKYGVRLLDTFGGRTVHARLTERCFHVDRVCDANERAQVSTAAVDTRVPIATPRLRERFTFFWMPHVRRVLDLEKARRAMLESRPRAMAIVGAFLARAVVLLNVQAIVAREKRQRFTLLQADRAPVVRASFVRIAGNPSARERLVQHFLMERRCPCRALTVTLAANLPVRAAHADQLARAPLRPEALVFLGR